MGTNLRIAAGINDHHKGPLHAPLTLVEYGDYECPYCAVVAPDIEQLIKEFRSDICFVYRHFPLKGIHPHAELAALAAEAASLQDHFWEMHQLLFTHQENLSKDLIDLLAKKIGLNMNDFHHDIQDYQLLEKVRENQRGAAESGVDSTPSFFINGLKFEGSSSYWPLREAIETHLGGQGSAFI